MRGRTSATAVALMLLAGCTTAAPQPPSTAVWTQVSLPSGARASSLARIGDELLVGGFVASGTSGSGQTPDDVTPLLARVRGTAVAGEFQLEPADPYAKVADLQSLAAAGDAVYAIGQAVGGAHANPRPTPWDGSLAAGRLTSHTQEFFTFGGHDAGPLLGTVVVDGRPVVFGSRTTTTGPRGVLWTNRGTTWTQQDRVVPALASSPDRELGFSGLARLGDRIVVAGDELGLVGGLHQQPAAFVGTVDGPWQQVALPVPDGLAAVPGVLSRATSVACADSGDTCWFAGWARGHALAWPVQIDPDGTLQAGAAVQLPGDPPSGADPMALVTLVDDRPAVLTNAATTLWLGCPDGWRGLTAPPGITTAVAATPGGLYAIAGDALWRLAVPAC